MRTTLRDRWRATLSEWRWPSRDELRQDLAAALTGAAVGLPQCVAFALIAGLPPQYGLYTAVVPAIVATLFGASRHMVTGPAMAISLMVFAAVTPHATPGTAEYVGWVLTLSLLVGVFQLALAGARLGALVDFVSHTVIAGFTAGVAVLIAISQLPAMLGVTLPSGVSARQALVQLDDALLAVNPAALVVGLTTLVVIVGLRRMAPRFPAMLAGLIVGSALAVLLGRWGHQVLLVGALPAGLPPLSMPDLSPETVRTLASSAGAIALLGLVEAVSIARSIAAQSGQRISGNREFLGQGLANVVGSFTSSYPVSGSFTRSAVNFVAGGRTRLAPVGAALLILLSLIWLAPMAAYLPMPGLAGLLLFVAWRLVDLRYLRALIRTSRGETVVWFATWGATLVLSLDFAVYLGVLLSLLVYLSRTTQPAVVRQVPDPDSTSRHFISSRGKYRQLPECPQLGIVRIDGSLFFGAVAHVEAQLRALEAELPDQKHLLLLGAGINFIDITAAEWLAREAEHCRDAGGELYLSGLKPPVLDVLHKSGQLDRIGRDNIFPNKGVAIARLVPRLDPERCRVCVRRIFTECGPLPNAAPATPEAHDKMRQC